jgi:arylsulfatase A-like enzyme
MNKGNGPSIVFITIDTLRADHLGSYGSPRNTTPNIDKIAEKGVLFENAISQAPWTLPSMMSMFTSLYPSELGAKGIGYKVKYSILTIPEYMRNNFYNTIGVTSHIIVSKIYTFDQGFNTFNQDPITRVDELSAKMLTDKAIGYVTANKDDKFFLWVHYLDPHQNYINNTEFDYTDDYSGNLGEILDNKFLNQKASALDKEDMKYIKDVYDEEISYNDKQIGRLLDTIEDLGLSDNTIIVLTSDHGEEFLERTRIGHGSSLHKELTHVPLIIYDPHDSDNSAKRISNNVETRNIAKTMTELAGLDENIFEGFNIMDSKNLESNHIVISENYGYKVGLKQESVIYDNWRLLSNLHDDEYELYNLENDREEKNNLLADSNEDILAKKEKLQAMMSIVREHDGNNSEDLELNPEDIKQLKALGYIQ